MDMMILGMIGDSSQTVDPFLSDQITSSLFAENPPHGLGEDLAALNIQRGRDHGIPGQIFSFIVFVVVVEYLQCRAKNYAFSPVF